MNRKLKRSRENKVLAGVCGGIGEYFKIDPVIVRILWVLIAFMPGGPGILAYLICALIIPEDDGIIHQNGYETSSTHTGNTTVFLGIALIVVGGFMLAKIIWPQFAFRFVNIFKYWPLLLIILGVYILYNQKNK